MPLSAIAIDSLREADLQRLVDNQVPEGRRIEYKRDLPGNSDEDRREFLKDISAIANALGGDVFYGISEDGDGNPVEVVGVEEEDWDQLARNLEQRLRDGLRPRIVGLQIRRVPLSNGRMIVMVRIPRSILSPHMISFKGNGRFFLRHTNNSEQMDVDELRQAYLRTASWQDQAREFRERRISIVRRGLGPLRGKPGEVFIHILPLGDRGDVLEMRVQEVRNILVGMQPLLGGGGSRYNFDGWLNYSDHSYTQIFRDGKVESCHMSWLGDDREGNDGMLASELFAREVRFTLNDLLRSLHALAVQPPFVVFLSLFDTEGLVIPTGRRPIREYERGSRSIDRDELWIPGEVLESWDTPADQLLKPILDTLWNASGQPHCPYYDSNGDWKLGE